MDDFSYDKLNRLTSISEKLNGTGNNTFKQAYIYDRWGNRTIDQGNTTANVPHPGYTAAPLTNRLNAPTGNVLNAPPATMIYDEAGNLTQDSTRSAGTSHYDAENRLSVVEFPLPPSCDGPGEEEGGGESICNAGDPIPSIQYRYDGDGRRVRRLPGGFASPQIWHVYGFDGELLADYLKLDGSSPGFVAQPQTEYGYRNGHLLVTAEPYVNVALNKTATQTNNFDATTTANKAVNGDANGRFFSGSVSATNYGLNSWWQVDLQGVQNIDNITVWGRTDCCHEMSTDFYVFVSDSPFTSTDLNTTLNQSGVSNYHYTDYAGPASLSINRTGRYVRVQIVGTMYLVLGEVQVWTAAAKVNWLVADQLGTPRMIADLSGSLAGISRHDYLPFGEEVPTELRNGAAGYSGIDNVRQKFTSKERDSETGLDYFGARYYASGHGRFVSTDPIVITPDRLIDPQEINLYQYARNNPLRFNDPTGEDIDDSSLKDNAEFQEWKKELLATEAGRAQWNKYNDDHSVTITISMGPNHGGKEGAETTPTFDATGKLTGATIVLGTHFAQNAPVGENYPISSSLTPSEEHGSPVSRETRAIAFLAHEFGHVEDAQRIGGQRMAKAKSTYAAS